MFKKTDVRAQEYATAKERFASAGSKQSGLMGTIISSQEQFDLADTGRFDQCFFSKGSIEDKGKQQIAASPTKEDPAPAPSPSGPV